MAKNNSGCLVLFALPFAGVGVGMAIWMGWTVLNWSRAKSWVQTPATILKTELVESHDDDGTTYRATAEYVYDYAGKRYRSTRVGLSCGNDNVGSYQQDIHRHLSECRQAGRAHPCFVNPADPAESLLDRDLRFGMLAFQALFVVVFGGAGGAMLVGGTAALRKKRHAKRSAAAAPEKPWLCRQDWQSGLIRSRSGWRLGAAVGFAFFWNLVSSPLYFFLPDEVFVKGNLIAAFGFLFPLVGLGLIAWAVLEIMRRGKYGVSVFQMAAVPGVLGGQLAGVVRIPVRIEPEEGFRTTLRCYLRRIVHSSDSDSVQEDVLWETGQVVVRSLHQADPSSTAIPVQFGIPYDCRPSDIVAGETAVCWRLEVAAEMPGVDYRTEFEVPVFRTDESREDFQSDTSAIAEYVAPVDSRAVACESGVEITASPEGEGIRLVFARGRHVGMLAFVLLFAMIWSGVVAGLAWGGVSIFAAIFGFFDLILVYACFDLLLFRSVVDATRQGVRVAAGYFVLGDGQWIDSARIERFDIRSNMSSGNTRYFDLAVICKDGKRVALGKRIRGQQAAELVVAELNKAIAKP